jgi:hypothetical protein
MPDQEGFEEDTQRQPTDFEQEALELRKEVKAVAKHVKVMVDRVRVGAHITTADEANARLQQSSEDRGEMIADLMLAYRHLEDASMRLGKAIQAHNGGTSVYDRDSTVGA